VPGPRREARALPAASTTELPGSQVAEVGSRHATSTVDGWGPFARPRPRRRALEEQGSTACGRRRPPTTSFFRCLLASTGRRSGPSWAPDIVAWPSPQPDETGTGSHEGPAGGPSEGRFILGPRAAQIKPHITKRFSMPGSHPGRPHGEMMHGTQSHLGVLDRRDEADFHRRLYTHTLMTPSFNPAPMRRTAQRQGLLAWRVGELMTEVAGEVCERLSSATASPPSATWLRSRAGAGARRRQGLAHPRGRGDLRSRLRGHRPRRTRDGEAQTPAPSADRVSRLHARLPGGPRAARVGRPPDDLNRMSKEGK